jgi:hypothetical protein
MKYRKQERVIARLRSSPRYSQKGLSKEVQRRAPHLRPSQSRRAEGHHAFYTVTLNLNE